MAKPESLTIFILHGWTYDLKKWRKFFQELSKLSIHTKLLQIPGLTAPLNRIWGLNDYASWLDSELQDKKRVILLGHSFGGQIAIRYAALHPTRLKKLILIASAGIRDNSLSARGKRIIFLILAKLGKILTSDDFFRRILYKLAGEQDYYKAPLNLRKTMSQVIQDEVLEDLAKIITPTCIIWGRKDRVTPVSFADIFQKNIKGSELHIIDSARHSPQFSKPKEVAGIVKKFLT